MPHGPWWLVLIGEGLFIESKPILMLFTPWISLSGSRLSSKVSFTALNIFSRSHGLKFVSASCIVLRAWHASQPGPSVSRWPGPRASTILWTLQNSDILGFHLLLWLSVVSRTGLHSTSCICRFSHQLSVLPMRYHFQRALQAALLSLQGRAAQKIVTRLFIRQSRQDHHRFADAGHVIFFVRHLSF